MKQIYMYLWYPLFQAQWDRLCCSIFSFLCSPFYFGHGLLYPSSIYGFWLPLWYLQTILIKPPLKQVMVATMKHSKWWLQLNQAMKYRINWEIYTQYAGAAGLLLHINGKFTMGKFKSSLFFRKNSFLTAPHYQLSQPDPLISHSAI
jgi:hypothetical protein